tara:strand:- start:3422 stop:3613 length:192 start_codon:yes stop_codon:yes gene_type:complete
MVHDADNGRIILAVDNQWHFIFRKNVAFKIISNVKLGKLKPVNLSFTTLAYFIAMLNIFFNFY